MSGPAPEPVAQGEIAKTPFAHILLHLHDKGSSGTLVLWPDESAPRGQDRILFADGWPVAARLLERAAALDRGLLPLFARKSGVYAFYKANLVGDDALRQQVDPLLILAASLRGSARDDVVDGYVSALGDASLVRFRPSVDIRRFQLQPKEAAFVDVIRAGPATVGELISQCELGPVMGRRLLYLLLVTRALERFDATSSPLATARAATPAGSRTSSILPRPGESASTSPATVRPLAVAPHGLEPPADLPLPELPLPEPSPAAPPAGLASQRPPAPETGTSARGSAAPSLGVDRAGAARFRASMPLPGPAPEGLSPEAAAFWAEVAKRCEVIERQTYFEMLDVPRDASSESVRKAYFALAKRWHPDRLTGELAPLRPCVEAIFALLTTAHDTLADESKRGPYLRQVQEGGGTPEADRKLEAILWAAKEHQKAEILVRRRDFAGAAELLSAAIAEVNDEPDLLATYAWCLFHTTSGDARFDEMMTAVDRAIALEPKHDRAHYYRGMILERVGRSAEALAAFKRAVELNPKNTDAVREVRLAEMRSKAGNTGKHDAARAESQSGSKSSPTGFLSKLFGGGKKT